MSDAVIVVDQDGIKSFFSALINPQHYEIFVDGRKAGELTGYQTRSATHLAPGKHSIYVRAYARDSVTITRTFSYSETVDVELSAGERRSFTCGLIPGPPLRTFFIFGGLFITILVLFIPAAYLTLRTRNTVVTLMALAILAFSWYGYSTKPGANIYLRQV